jgi:transcriptional regulator with XRE-family HTH domain
MADESIGFRIRRARMWRGVTQAELARQIDISANALNAIEKGYTQAPRADIVQRIARVLRVSADFLLALSDELGPEPSWCTATWSEDEEAVAAPARAAGKR